MRYIRKDDYSDVRERPNLLKNYLDAMVGYLKSNYPNISDDDIIEFVKQTVKDRFKSPQVKAVVHHREGYSDQVSMSLVKFIKDVIKDNNLSPSGSCYKPVSEEPSFLRQSIEGKVKERNTFKKLYLGYLEEGAKREAEYYNQNQANAKIFNNAIAGGMNISQFILGSTAGFNAITSVGRMCVKQGYSFIERAVNGNIYLPTEDAAISYVLNHIRYMNPEFEKLITQGVLYVPTDVEVYEHLLISLRNYILNPVCGDLYKLIYKLSEVERSYIFYVGCIINLCKYNESMMREWIDSCFISGTIDPTLYKDIDLGEIKQFSGDIVSCILSTNYKRLGENPEKPGKWNSIKDAAEFNPEGLREFIYICKHFVTNFEKMTHVLKPIMQIQTTFSKLVFQDKMARETVPLSDTDSNIFSNQELIRWKRNRIDFEQESYEMNAIVTFILSQSLEHVFARLSAGFGAEGDDVFKISMKNEFLYPILIVTSKGKHYLAIATMQEGSYLSSPRKDIKGVAFRSSAYPKIIKDDFEKYVVDLFSLIEQGKPIRAGSILSHISKIEHRIADSIKGYSSDFLQTVSIKKGHEYKDADISAYFYYELWQEVFAPTYGDMIIPNKCFKIPLIGEGKILETPEFLEKLERTQPDVYARLMAFKEKRPDRNITSIAIPPSKGDIHPFFAEIMDVRMHISQVLKGYYLILEALGIGSVYLKANALVSDFSDPAAPEISL